MPYEIHICILCLPYEMCFGGWHARISHSDLYVLVLPLLVKQGFVSLSLSTVHLEHPFGRPTFCHHQRKQTNMSIFWAVSVKPNSLSFSHFSFSSKRHFQRLCHPIYHRLSPMQRKQPGAQGPEQLLRCVQLKQVLHLDRRIFGSFQRAWCNSGRQSGTKSEQLDQP